MKASTRRAPPAVDQPLALLGGLTPRAFLRRHWQRHPYLVRGALPELQSIVSRARLFALAARDAVESRLVTRASRDRWTLAHGPFRRRALPRLDQRRWTLLVQGVDLHDDRAHELLSRFRFVPDARLDDLMISWASLGGGVGPHVDSYDVFLLQASGCRRWRIGRQCDVELDPRAPLKILRRFVPTTEYVLEPGDLLYLPPQWAHEGVALDGDCMTYSVGMRAPQRASFAGELVARLAETFEDNRPYRDAGATVGPPAAIPAALGTFAARAVRALTTRPDALTRAVGEVLSEPKPQVWFETNTAAWRAGAVVLDRRTRMLYDGAYVFINGESLRPPHGAKALLRGLADRRELSAAAVRRATRKVRALLAEWHRAGWLHLRRNRRATTV